MWRASIASESKFPTIAQIAAEFSGRWTVRRKLRWFERLGQVRSKAAGHSTGWLDTGGAVAQSYRWDLFL